MFKIIENRPWKLGLLQIATKFITNCDGLAYYKLRQNPITDCGSWFITNCDKFITNYDSYYKLSRLLQIATEQSSINRFASSLRK